MITLRMPWHYRRKLRSCGIDVPSGNGTLTCTGSAEQWRALAALDVLPSVAVRVKQALLPPHVDDGWTAPDVMGEAWANMQRAQRFRSTCGHHSFGHAVCGEACE